MAHMPRGFKWLGVLRSRSQAFCTGDKFASTTSPASHSPARCHQITKTPNPTKEEI